MRNLARLLPCDDDTVGLWHLDGLLKDESGNGFDLTVDTGTARYMMGSAPDRRAGYFDSTILFRSGYDAALDIKGDLTLEAMVYVTEIPSGFKDIVAFHGGPTDTEVNNTLYQMGVEGSGASCHVFYAHENAAGVNNTFIWDNVNAGTDALTLPINKWVYRAMVRDDTAKTVTLYINGTAHPVVYTYPNSPTGGSASRLALGGFWPANINLWGGGITSVRVSPIQRTATEIAANADRVLATRAVNMTTLPRLPEILPSAHANLTLWLKADQNDTDDGDSVTTPTLVGGANNVTQATLAERPLLHLAGGKPSWRMWDGTNGRWFDGADVSDYIQLSPPRYHAYCAFLLEDATLNNANWWENHRLFGDDAGWWGVYARRDNFFFHVYAYHWDTGQNILWQKVSLNEPHILQFWYDANTGEMVFEVDNLGEGRLAVGGITGSNTLEVGGNLGDPFPGSIMELVLADDVDPDTRVGIWNYFMNEYQTEGLRDYLNQALWLLDENGDPLLDEYGRILLEEG